MPDAGKSEKLYRKKKGGGIDHFLRGGGGGGKEKKKTTEARKSIFEHNQKQEKGEKLGEVTTHRRERGKRGQCCASFPHKEGKGKSTQYLVPTKGGDGKKKEQEEKKKKGFAIPHHREKKKGKGAAPSF